MLGFSEISLDFYLIYTTSTLFYIYIFNIFSLIFEKITISSIKTGYQKQLNFLLYNICFSFRICVRFSLFLFPYKYIRGWIENSGLITKLCIISSHLKKNMKMRFPNFATSHLYWQVWGFANSETNLEVKWIPQDDIFRFFFFSSQVEMIG